MKAKVPDLLEKGRVLERDPAMRCPGEWYGRFVVRHPSGVHLQLVVSAGDSETWEQCGFPPPAFEHVSVALSDPTAKRCPTWGEMAWVKDLCWGAEECVVQYHPPLSEYVNNHPFVLHLWKPVGVDIPRPPAATVGVIGATLSGRAFAPAHTPT